MCVLQMKSIKKNFGGTKALRGVDLDVYQGEVHGIVGENGAGKSTLIKILARELKEDAGTIKLREESLNELSPWEIQERGIMVVHQDLNVIPSLNIGQNILLGSPPTRKFGLLHWKKGYPKAKEALELVSHSLHIHEPVSSLSAAQRQLVILARAIAQAPRVLILDEPTARLGLEETAQLFSLLQKLKQKEVTILYISHRLEEIYQVCDRVTVLRDGTKVSTTNVSQISQEELVGQMIGRKVDQLVPERNVAVGETIVEVKNLQLGTKVRGISFSIQSGEIVGLVGPVGAGKSEVLNSLFGAEIPDDGQIFIDARPAHIRKPSDAISTKITLVPEDRNRDGLVMDFMVSENLTLVDLKSLSRKGLINKKQEERTVSQLIQQLLIDTPTPSTNIRHLSGGNQQKVVLGKWLLDQRRVFLLDEVTAGIDVGAKFEIYRLLGDLAEAGTAILLATSDIHEALGLCDRLLVMHRGHIVAELLPETTSEEKVLTYMMGGGNS